MSRSVLGGDIGALEDLRHQSVAANRAFGITGALYYDSEMFFQLLEGPIGALDPLVERIRQDLRHRDMHIVSRVESVKRSFVGWSMKFVSGIANPELARRFDFEELSRGDRGIVHARVRELAQA